jgi:hypothetical protein
MSWKQGGKFFPSAAYMDSNEFGTG